MDIFCISLLLDHAMDYQCSLYSQVISVFKSDQITEQIPEPIQKAFLKFYSSTTTLITKSVLVWVLWI